MEESIIAVLYKDIPFSERHLCAHINPIGAVSTADRAAKWEKLRGQSVLIDLNTFKAGECSQCDSWLVADSKQCVPRCDVEIGD